MRRAEIFEPIPDIWCIRHLPTRSCAYIVKTSPGALLVDAGPHRSASDIMMGLQRARVGLSSVRALVLTHAHADQAAGAAAFQKRSRTKLYCAETELPNVMAIADVSVERFIGDGDLVEGLLEVFATKGPAPGHLSFYLRSHRALFHGDASPGALPKKLHSEVEWLLPAHGRPPMRRELDLNRRTR